MYIGNMESIEAQLTISASYDDEVCITVRDKSSGNDFLELKLTREQFINACMNRLACTNVERAGVRSLDIVGKKQEIKSFEFELPVECRYGDVDVARSIIKNVCPGGWKPDLGFSSQDSFFTRDSKSYARTIIRRWV